MNTKFDFKNLWKEHRKEIIIVSIYGIAFLTLAGFISYFKIQRSDKLFDESLAKIQYDNLRNSNVTEAQLEEELQIVTEEVEIGREKIPVNLKNTDVNLMLTEIIQDNNNLFSLANCNISESKTKTGYSSYEVRVNSINGSYNQVKSLLDYINNYKVKISITQLELNRDVNNMQGSMTMVFYGEKEVEDEV